MSEEQDDIKKYALLDDAMAKYSEPGQLISILQEAQNIFGYLPQEVQQYIAEKLDMPVSRVNGVVTFYSLFKTSPGGKYTISVCMGTACYVQGARGLLEDFRQQLNLNENDTTPDGLFTVKNTRCIGACGLAPVLTINEDVHGKLLRKDVARLLRKYKKATEVQPGDQIHRRPGKNQEPVSPQH